MRLTMSSLSIQDRVAVDATDAPHNCQLILAFEGDGTLCSTSVLHYGYNREDGAFIDGMLTLSLADDGHDWVRAGIGSDELPLDYKVCGRCEVSSEEDYGDCTGAPVRLELLVPARDAEADYMLAW
jgi:hypothetical protein